MATTSLQLLSVLLLMQVLPGVHAILSSSKRLAVVSTGATPESNIERVQAFLQEDANTKQSTKTSSNPAAWFGGFSQGESTFDHDGTLAGRSTNPDLNVLDGWEPPYSDEGSETVRSADWFVESPSGGKREAWQTFYPAEGDNLAGNNVQTGEWFTGAGGTWQQQYRSRPAREGQDGGILASWFDSHVRQLDGFGREKLPGLGAPRNYLDWEERSVNTTLSCEKPGCNATVSLLAPFDSSSEVSKNCRLSVYFYPTDFDDQHSGEMVSWIQVNNKMVSSNCRPFAGGCNQTAQRPLLPCVNDLLVDDLMTKNGVFSVAAKIPDVVDECPHNGSMLSAVPMMTCLVSKKPQTFTPKPVKASWFEQNSTCVSSMPLQCATRGCASEIAMPACNPYGTCTLSINVSQTDYDGSGGLPELIEYIKVAGEKVASSLKPGQNPCRTQWKGDKGNLTQGSGYNFVALSKHPVNVSSGRVLIEGKISEHVDECASNGYLFDAIAEVACKGPPLSKSEPKPKPALLSQKRYQSQLPSHMVTN